jgi:chromosome segregation ATPase
MTLSPSDLDRVEVLAAKTTSDLRMDAYYYGFASTGAELIDRILSAVACAGKAYHYTESWDEDTPPYEDCFKGKCPVDWMQNAANDAAELFGAIPALIAYVRELETVEPKLASLRCALAEQTAQCERLTKLLNDSLEYTLAQKSAECERLTADLQNSRNATSNEIYVRVDIERDLAATRSQLSLAHARIGELEKQRDSDVIAIGLLHADIDRLREGLQFYADKANWIDDEQVNCDEHFTSAMSFESDGHGNRARAALAYPDQKEEADRDQR